MARLTQEEIITRFRIAHGNKYDYSKFIYQNIDTKGIIICSIHGEFKQSAYRHGKGSGCQKCGGSQKLNFEEVILQFNNRHNNYYDYSKAVYVNDKTKVEIICPKHGSFFQSPNNHKKGKGCKKCQGLKLKEVHLLSNAEVLNDFIIQHKNRYDYSRVEYVNSKTTVEIICKKHGSFMQLPSLHKSGSGCPKCAISLNSKKATKSLKSVIQDFKRVHQNTYDYSTVNYVNSKTKVEIICKKHGSFFQSPAHHKKGVGCPSCYGTPKISLDQILLQFVESHGMKYDYSKVAYIDSKTNVEIICPNHGSFFQSPSLHKKGSGCKKCANEISKKTHRKPKEQVIKDFKVVHGDKYDYSKMNYINNNTKIEIICSIHGSFFQTPASHQVGSNCKHCALINQGNARKIGLAELLNLFNNKHGFKYDYSKIKYVHGKKKVEIVCPTHGSFWQSPNHHKKGVGCPTCAGRYHNLEFLINDFQSVHGIKYDYSKVIYKAAKKKVEIICPIHGSFWQSPSHHKKGVGCPTCNRGWSHKSIYSFLDSVDNVQLSKMDSIELLTIINQGKLPDKLKSLVFSQEDNREHSIRALKEELLEEENINDIVDGPVNLEIEENETLANEELEELNSSKQGASNELLTLSNSFDDLHGLDHPIVDSCDKEAIEFLIQYKLRRFWNRTLNNEINIKSFKKEKGGTHFQTLKDTFLDEYKLVEKYKPPRGYKFPYDPNMMQKLTVYRIKKNKRYGNWSGTGAGKTVSFIITSREIDSRLTILVGLNSTMEQLGVEILSVFPDSKIYYNSKNYTPPEGFQFHYYKKGLVFDRKNHNFLILNYDKFQQAYSEKLFQDLTTNNQIDFICIDEIHNVKQRTEEQESKRRATLKRLIGRAAEQNENLHVLGMSATPVINNLKEAKSLLEMVTGKEYDDLLTTRTLNNAIQAFKHLTLNGLRYKPKYDIVLKELTGENTPKLKLDGTDVLDRLLKLGNTNYSKAEQILLELKLNAVKSMIGKGTVIYTYFTTGMVQAIKDYLSPLGLKIGTFTGNEGTKEREDSKKAFIEGEIDILIGSQPIGTGVNGLQYVCKRMIILSLPWTDSEYTQLKGRIYRQGSKFGEVEIIIPQVYIPLEDKEWSWDLQRLNLIRNKKTLADAAVDGVIPDRTLPSPKTLFKKSQEALKEWKERLSKGDYRVIQREDLKFPLHPEVLETLRRKLGDFSVLNQKWSISDSKKTHKRIKDNPEEWYLYHELYSQKRETWSEIPFKIIASWIKRKDFIVADLGCGQNLLKDEIPKNKVLSFDHYAIDENVTACDISSIPLENDSVDISILCLALMGSNSKDYLREAFRITRPMGYLFIAEPKKKHIEKVDEFTQLLKEIGFGNIDVDVRENFIYWKCGKL